MQEWCCPRRDRGQNCLCRLDVWNRGRKSDQAGGAHELAEIAALEFCRRDSPEIVRRTIPSEVQALADEEEGLVPPVVDLRKNNGAPQSDSAFVLVAGTEPWLEERPAYKALLP